MCDVKSVFVSDNSLTRVPVKHNFEGIKLDNGAFEARSDLSAYLKYFSLVGIKPVLKASRNRFVGIGWKCSILGYFQA